jgi:transcription initiation factor IIE alpha subunit
VDAESECSNCNVARIFKTVTPLARKCQMRSFECPKCGSVLKIVAFGRRSTKAPPKKLRRLVRLPRRWD